MKSVLILSKWNAGGVAGAVERLRARDLRPVLVTELPDSRHRSICDDHVVVDWDTEDLAALVARLDERGIVPTAIINMVEVLIPWQTGLAVHYDLPGASAARDVLASKTSVRERMRALGVSTVAFSSDPAQVDFYPAIAKPARESSGSWLVRRVNGPEELQAYQRHLAEIGCADTELIIEEFLEGTEFTADGPVVGGRFHPVLAVERPEHDDIRHHNAGLQVYPPQSDHVINGVQALRAKIDALCADLGIEQGWLHIEARADEAGRTELIEINPRPAGGMYDAVIREVSGIDPVEAFVAITLGEFAFSPEAERPAPAPDRAFIGMYDVEAEELGTVRTGITADEMRALPGVLDAEVTDGYEITTLDKENFFIRFAFTAESLSALRARMTSLLAEIDGYRVG
ncbi:Phosphoribosylglycinamide synthetase [Kitasatospora sp. MMS16-BH015]|uniref:ATP-grasp domain-containing protein n=1 Tax=Kitasatospora sp. MMS16-BH015 TaxID=2018025 RepID=UPI000CA19928|nr:ATP-grasp domain-containing protein [Kitasatospora sp. MMS16-BH015]AUG80391.1 Phosphoribosylglycinamide synthetase [Kitasatospora sp. MMS16-BH015]